MRLESKPFSLIVLQPTSFCNINCSYCYLSVAQRNTKGIMSEEVLDKTFESIFQNTLIASTNKTLIVWHSGEPLTVPKNFYITANNIITKYKPTHLEVTQRIITNGILIDDEWCEIFTKYNLNLVISIDGPDFLHNIYRKNRNNTGSYAKVLRGIRVLQKHNIDFGVLSTITEQTLDFPNELFSFYKEMNFKNIGLNFEEVSAYNEISTLGLNLMSKVKTFIMTLYSLSKKEENIKIREFEKMKSFIIFGDMYDIEYDNLTPLSNLTIDKNGNFTTFVAELSGMNHERYGDFSLGNILKNKLTDIFTNEKFLRLQAEINKGVQLCKDTCDYFEVCGSSKPDAKLSADNKLPYQGRFDVTESFNCLVNIKVMADIIIADFEDNIKNTTTESLY